MTATSIELERAVNTFLEIVRTKYLIKSSLRVNQFEGKCDKKNFGNV